jgi:nitroreductase
MNVKEAIFGRRSIRDFAEEPVDASTLKEIMLAGIYAP